MPLLSTFGAASARSFGGIGAAAAGAGLDIDEAFSAYLYEGTGSAQTITNGVDLSGEGGLVWIKNRDTANGHNLEDTERGAGKSIYSNTTDEQYNLTGTSGLSSFNSNGFSITGSQGRTNTNGNSYAAWTFRKAPKFFDVVQFTNSTGGDEDVSHNLNAVPAMIIGKRTDTADNWMVWHIGTGMSNGGFTGLGLDNTGSAAFTGVQSDQGINSNTFNTGYVLSNDGSGGYSKANQLNGEYIFYLFAHNDGDGEFGPDADQDVIKCGSVNANSTFTLPWQPQWILSKDVNRSGDWHIIDSMRGFTASSNYDKYLEANNSNAEQQAGWFDIDGNTLKNRSGGNIIYMAIRRGPLAEPTSATDVFGIDTYDTTTGDATAYDTTFTVDMVIQALNKNTTIGWRVNSRLTGINYFKTNTDGAEITTASSHTFDTQTGFRLDSGTDANDIAYMWKRAPSYFDVVTWDGNSTEPRNHPHGLQKVPEMIWLKRRDTTKNWYVYHKDLDASAPETKYLSLNATHGVAGGGHWYNTAPTSTVFTTSDSSHTNASGGTYIAYLFATVAGVSKVGSVSHSFNSTTNVDCGFSSGARFVLVKSTSTGDWYVWDSVRGIVSGNDPYLALNKTDAEVTNGDLIDPYSGGFALSPGFYTDTYIFYAIA